eukprot:COSAG02_NODE_667_length_18713_cov_17.795262_16_plen_83_part_00
MERAYGKTESHSGHHQSNLRGVPPPRQGVKVLKHMLALFRRPKSSIGPIASNDPIMLVPQAHTRHRRIPEFRDECRRQSGGD